MLILFKLGLDENQSAHNIIAQTLSTIKRKCDLGGYFDLGFLGSLCPCLHCISFFHTPGIGMMTFAFLKYCIYYLE